MPSPYEIFDMERRDIYGRHTKLKYYELVKIYHPDRSGTGCESLSNVERLERVSLMDLRYHNVLQLTEFPV